VGHTTEPQRSSAPFAEVGGDDGDALAVLPGTRGLRGAFRTQPPEREVESESEKALVREPRAHQLQDPGVAISARTVRQSERASRIAVGSVQVTVDGVGIQQFDAHTDTVTGGADPASRDVGAPFPTVHFSVVSLLRPITQAGTSGRRRA